MATKHEQIIQYIQNLPIDSKISVRSIARNLKVSEGTAYRAIKSAENLHLVATKERREPSGLKRTKTAACTI